MRLKNKVAIITGAGQGLGEAIALRLTREGCKTVVADIDLEKAKEVTQKIKDIWPLPGRSLPVTMKCTCTTGKPEI